MAIAFDAKSQNTTTFLTADSNWTHTPVGAPAGVIVLYAQCAASTDQVVSITYGGKTLQRIRRDVNTSGEITITEIWFYGGNDIPTGAQTVTVDINSTARYCAAAITVISDSGATEVDIDNGTAGTTNNPSLLLDYTDGLADWIAFADFCEGATSVTGLSIDVGTSLFENDMGAQCSSMSYLEGTGGNSTTFTTTSSNAANSLSGVVVRELIAVVIDYFIPSVSPDMFVPGGHLSQPWVGTDDIVAAGTSAFAECATVLVTGNGATLAVSPTAQNIALTVSANNPSPRVAPTAQLISLSVVANNTTSLVSPQAQSIALTVTANNPSPSILVNAECATVSVTAFNPSVTVGTAVSAGLATVTVTANDSTVSVAPGASNAPVTVIGNAASPAISVPAGSASVTVSGLATTSAVAPTAQNIAISTVANNTSQKVDVSPGSAPVSVVANDATVQTVELGEVYNQSATIQPGLSPWGYPQPMVGTGVGNFSSAAAECANVTVVANNASVSSSSNVLAGLASVTVTAQNTTSKVSPTPQTAPVTVTANNAAMTRAQAGLATVTVNGLNPGPSVAPTAGSAPISVSALAPSLLRSTNALAEYAAVNVTAGQAEGLGEVLPPDLTVRKYPPDTALGRRRIDAYTVKKYSPDGATAHRKTDAFIARKYDPDHVVARK